MGLPAVYVILPNWGLHFLLPECILSLVDNHNNSTCYLEEFIITLFIIIALFYRQGQEKEFSSSLKTRIRHFSFDSKSNIQGLLPMYIEKILIDHKRY